MSSLGADESSRGTHSSIQRSYSYRYKFRAQRENGQGKETDVVANADRGSYTTTYVAVKTAPGVGPNAWQLRGASDDLAKNLQSSISTP